MQYSELKVKNEDQLKEMDQGLRRELFNLRFQKSAGELSKPTEFKAKRKAIAKIQTALTELKSKKKGSK